MKKILLLVLSSSLIFACAKKANVSTEDTAKNEVQAKKVIASNSWTAAFADLAGIDNIEFIAPANLNHPPEYEVTVSDIKKITESDYFIFAGFEKMMNVLSNNVGNSQKVKITCNNSLQNIQTQVLKIAQLCGNKEKSKARLKSLTNTFLEGAALVEKSGLKGAKVFCNKNQIYLAKDLGFEVVATFGPGPVTSQQIALAKSEHFIFIIDNFHNPVSAPLAQVAPNSKIIMWKNFPENGSRTSLEKLIRDNIEKLELE